MPEKTPARPPITFAPDVPIWERQSQEKAHHWAAFFAFREMGAGGGKRSCPLLIRQWERDMANGVHVKPPSLSISTLRGWAMIYRWTERVDAYDNHLVAEAEERRKRKREAMRSLWEDREMQILEDWFEKLNDLRRVVQAIDQHSEPDDDGNIIHILRANAHEIRQALGAHADLLKLKALILGDPTEITEQRMQHGLNLDDLMKEIERARRRINGNERPGSDTPGDTDTRLLRG